MAEKISITAQLADHDHRIEMLEHHMDDFTQSLKRVDDSNTYLRKQNDKILNAIVKQNQNADRHRYEIEKLTKTNRLKMFVTVFGASGLAFAVVELIIKLI